MNISHLSVNYQASDIIINLICCSLTMRPGQLKHLRSEWPQSLCDPGKDRVNSGLQLTLQLKSKASHAFYHLAQTPAVSCERLP